MGFKVCKALKRVCTDRIFLKLNCIREVQAFISTDSQKKEKIFKFVVSMFLCDKCVI